MSTQKQIWLIPYAHLDTQWRWEYPTTIKKYIKSTLDENFHLFDTYPEYTFNFTGALRYAMMKEYYPDKFPKAKKLIQEEKWHLSGTCLDETDTLSPSVESMIRNILYGDRWAMEEFGVSSRDYMIPDCFGFPANMPSILAHCGLDGFSTQKLTWGSAVGIPFEIGIWEGPDKNGIVCALNPGSYSSHLLKPLHKNQKRIEKLYRLGEKNGIWKSFQYYGVGDIGGAPTEGSVKRAIESIEHSKEIDPDLTVIHGSSDQFFKEITAEERQRMDSYAGDLLLINHSAGSLSSAAIMKRWNRKNEQLAAAAEAAAVTASIVAGTRYPIDKIKSAWYRTIGNQMHDILPGTSTPLAYEYSQNDEVVALNTWSSILDDSALNIAPLVSGTGEILLFNPLAEERIEMVNIPLSQIKVLFPDSESFAFEDSEGKSYMTQILQQDDGEQYLCFKPTMSPLSWARYSIKQYVGTEMAIQSEENVQIESQSNGYILSNSFYNITITKNGVISSIFHKKLQQELLKSPLAYEFQREKPKFFPAWNMDWKDREKPPFLRIEGGMVHIVEEGTLRCTLKIEKTLNDSTFSRFVSLSQGSEVVKITEKIHWREQACALKLALDVNIPNPTTNFNWETSRTSRGVNNEKLFEMPSRYWVDLSGINWGVSMIEDSKYGYDHPNPSKIRLTLVYTPAVRKVIGFWDQAWQDWGEHTIQYEIFAHEGSNTFYQTDYHARCLNQPIRSFIIPKDISNQPKQNISLFQVDDRKIGVMAVKKAEDLEGFVLRLYDREGIDHSSKITFNTEIEDVWEINGLEEKISNLTYDGKELNLNLKANSISSILVALKKAGRLPISQKPLSLEFDAQLFGGNGSIQGLIPLELVPKSVCCGEIEFHLSSNTEKNALKLNGNKISIPPEYNTISLLIGCEKDSDLSFSWINGENIIKRTSAHVSAMTGYVGQWDTRLWKRTPTRHLKYKRDYVWVNKCIGIQPGFVKRDRIEFYTTHTHKSGEDLPYQYGYLYTIKLGIPNGADHLLLPQINGYLVAATVSNESITVEKAQYLIDKYDF